MIIGAKMRVLVFLLCFHVTSVVICSELTLFEDTLRKAFCVAILNQKNSSVSCYNTSCSADSFEISQSIKLNGTAETPRLICRSSHELSIAWNHVGFPSSFLEFSQEDFSKSSGYTQPTTCHRWILTDLKPNCSYQIRRWKAWSENNTYFYEVSDPYLLARTAGPDHGLLPISGFELKSLRLVGDNYDAILKWIPADDLPCRYRLDSFGVTNGEHVSKGISFPFPPYEERISGLKFGHTYNITLRAISPSVSLASFAESPPSYVIVDIPSCLSTYSNLSVCAPPAPENLDVLAKCNPYDQSCDVTIFWSTPELTPDEYELYIYSLKDDEIDDIRNVSVVGTANSTTLNSVYTGSYEIILRAISKAGSSGAAVIIRNFTASPVAISADVTTKLAVAFSAVTAAAAIVAVLIILRRRQTKKFGMQINHLYSKELLKIDVLSYKSSVKKLVDEWEVKLENITFEGVLGEGAFGLVRKGVLKKGDGHIEVGVKMLKPQATVEEVRQLYQEITIMKSVGAHPNLVSMIGCVTEERLEGPLLLVEYCPYGDLQTYLRKEWERHNNFYRDTNHTTSEEADNVFNKAYAFDNTQEFLTPNDLLSFARQIVLGMEHLSKLRVLHRDLAARNVLVCENKLVKVSDFGLSRDVYQNNVYCKHTGGRLPIRWMALESITHQRYTTQSDVWSFGVLLWEIVTLGQYPYPDVSNSDLLGFLRSGSRMKRPPHCGAELYKIMSSCWRENPKDRPTFTEIRTLLEALLEDAVSYVRL